jgi:large subunit ribosomal protein L19
MNSVVQAFENSKIIRAEVPFRIGDTVKVSLRIKEGEKERIQIFEGVVIAIKGKGGSMRFTVRKISYGVGAEKSFFYQSPMIKDIKVIRSGKIRRAKLFYLREKTSKKDIRIEESKKTGFKSAPGAPSNTSESSEVISTPIPETPTVDATSAPAPSDPPKA